MPILKDMKHNKKSIKKIQMNIIEPRISYTIPVAKALNNDSSKKKH